MQMRIPRSKRQVEALNKGSVNLGAIQPALDTNLVAVHNIRTHGDNPTVHALLVDNRIIQIGIDQFSPPGRIQVFPLRFYFGRAVVFPQRDHVMTQLIGSEQRRRSQTRQQFAHKAPTGVKSAVIYVLTYDQFAQGIDGEPDPDLPILLSFVLGGNSLFF